MSRIEAALVAAAALVLVARLAAAGAEGRLRASGWPLTRCGPAAGALLVHDVAIGWVGLALLGGAGRSIIVAAAGSDSGAAVVAVALALGALGLSEAVLRRRRGVGVAALCRPRYRVAEPRSTLRQQLLDAVERAGARGVSRWIDVGLDRGLDSGGGGVDQLLSALWPGIRLQLREAPGSPRTEVGLLLLQAQLVMDDASPARERMFTLLHLVHERAGRAGVRAALEQARRSAVRHSRSGAAAWVASADAVPRPAAPTPS